jgi:hypothetical protein
VNRATRRCTRTFELRANLRRVAEQTSKPGDIEHHASFPMPLDARREITRDCEDVGRIIGSSQTRKQERRMNHC